MNRSNSIHSGLRWLARTAPATSRRCYSSEIVGASRQHCHRQLQESDYDAHLIRRSIPPQAQDVYVALRALNLELLRIPDTVSNPTLGAMRIKFWKDAVNNTFAGKTPREPICTLLSGALQDMAQQENGQRTHKALKFWISRLIQTREKHMDNRPFASLASLEDYAEQTYSTMMYATLAALPMQSMDMDHLASHIGKAAGIAAVLRGVAHLAMPSTRPSASGGAAPPVTREPSLLLPLDIMANENVKEEDVFRYGPEAEGLSEAVFQVATRANDHLITAREMMKRLQTGQDAGHEFEHQGEQGHTNEYGAGDDAGADIKRAFGVLLEAVSVSSYLERLQKANFDVFKVKPAGWRAPWNVWRAVSSGKI